MHAFRAARMPARSCWWLSSGLGVVGADRLGFIGALGAAENILLIDRAFGIGPIRLMGAFAGLMAGLGVIRVTRGLGHGEAPSAEATAGGGRRFLAESRLPFRQSRRYMAGN